MNKEAYAILVSIIVDETEYQQITKEIQELLDKKEKMTTGIMSSKTQYINDVDCIQTEWVKYQVPDLSVHELNFIAASSMIDQ